MYCISLLLEPGHVCQASGDTHLIFKNSPLFTTRNCKMVSVLYDQLLSSFFFFTGLNKNSNQIYSEALLTSNMVPMYQSFQGKDL